MSQGNEIPLTGQGSASRGQIVLSGGYSMGVELISTQAGGVSVVGVSGRLTLGEGVGALRHKLSTMAREGQKNILLDLGGVTYLDSSGLGVLVASYATLSNLGGKLKLLKASARIKNLLILTKLYTVFEVFDDEHAALASFDQPVARPAAHD
jgi:anti-sigma B factor antagonist